MFCSFQESNLSFRFAQDADQNLYAPLDLGFSCEGREYGYYADVANSCQVSFIFLPFLQVFSTSSLHQVFHVCLPIEDDFGAIIETAHWSFICGNATVFDQETLTCNHEAVRFSRFNRS